MMKEERVTLNIIKWLQETNWVIICYDFPQSGTGIILHPSNGKINEKNKGGIIPDIIAVKDNQAVFFENKDKFVLSDFEKIYLLKTTSIYINSLYKLVGDRKLAYGIGIPKLSESIDKALNHKEKVDFIVTTDDTGAVYINYDLHQVFSRSI
ncbi:hypothetical protein [Neisseria dentiae]|uniref:hypothetical protein n=1 Tax=Neisseria dentiae TaxID=194197 RepID=UPI0035A14622